MDYEPPHKGTWHHTLTQNLKAQVYGSSLWKQCLPRLFLMMPKNQELRKFQRFKNQVLRIKIQESSFKNQESRTIKIKIQELREDSIKISIKKFFKTLSSTWSFHKIFYQRVLISSNWLPEGSNRLPVANIVFQIDLQSCNRLP